MGNHELNSYHLVVGFGEADDELDLFLRALIVIVVVSRTRFGRRLPGFAVADRRRVP